MSAVRAPRRLPLPLAAGLLLLAGAAAAGDHDPTWGPFRGRIVDADTGQPIPGAVAIVVWLQNLPSPVHGRLTYFDARAAVAGPDGAFEIPRRSRPLWSARIDPPRFDYTAPGYVVWRLGHATQRPGVVEMKSVATLAGDDRFRLPGTGHAGLIPLEDQRRLLDTVNEARERMGLHPLTSLRGAP